MKCPICGKDAVSEFQPFCSRRCAYVDLGKWLDEDYSIDDGSLYPDGEDTGMDGTHDTENT